MKKLISIFSILLLAAAVGMAQQSYPSGQASPGDQQSVIRGCLSGSEGNFTLAQEQTGSIFKLSGQDGLLKEHVGHMLQLNGHQDNSSSNTSAGAASQPTFIVSDVQMVSDKCASSTSSAAPAAGSSDQTASGATSSAQPVAGQSSAAANGTTASTGTTSTDTSSQSAASQPAPGTSTTDMNNQSAAAPSTSASSTTPATSADATNQSAATAGNSAAPASGAAAANPPASSDTTASTTTTTTGSTTTDVAAGQTSTANVTTGAPAASTSAADQSAAAPAADQNAQANAGEQQGTETASAKLPQTASPLPLLGLLGLGSLAAGAFSRRKK